MTKDPIEIFIERILKEANLASLPEDYKAEYIERLKAQVDRRIGIIAMRELDKAGQEEFLALMEKKPKPKKLQKFFQSRIPNFETKMKAGLEEFAKEFILAVKK